MKNVYKINTKNFNFKINKNPRKSTPKLKDNYFPLLTNDNKFNSYVHTQSFSTHSNKSFNFVSESQKNTKFLLSKDGFRVNTTKNFNYSFCKYIHNKLGK